MVKVIAALALSLPSLTYATDVQITEPDLSGHCEYDDIRVVEEEGKYYIAAFFSDMAAIAQGDVSYQKKRCTMDYKVTLPNYLKLEYFQFSVDGIYQLSDKGTARLTVSHRVANAPSARTTKFYSAESGDSKNGDIWDHTGDIRSYQLDPQFQGCGASIPLTTSIYTSASKPQSDLSGMTMIDLDEGVSSHVKLGRIKCRRCW